MNMPREATAAENAVLNDPKLGEAAIDLAKDLSKVLVGTATEAEAEIANRKLAEFAKNVSISMGGRGISVELDDQVVHGEFLHDDLVSANQGKINLNAVVATLDAQNLNRYVPEPGDKNPAPAAPPPAQPAGAKM